MLPFINNRQYFIDALYFMSEHYDLDINNTLHYQLYICKLLDLVKL